MTSRVCQSCGAGGEELHALGRVDGAHVRLCGNCHGAIADFVCATHVVPVAVVDQIRFELRHNMGDSKT